MTFVKEENINLTTMEQLYIFIINCELFKKITKLYEGACFGHVIWRMPKLVHKKTII
jgi:hypothetical protein